MTIPFSDGPSILSVVKSINNLENDLSDNWSKDM